METPELVASIDIEVPFHDVDVMKVAWHGHYIKYFEIARCALLRKFNYDYPQMDASGYLWPIVECHLKYVKPAFYGQKLRVEATLLEYQDVGVLLLLTQQRLRIAEIETIMVNRISGKSRIFSSWMRVFYYLLYTSLLCASKITPIQRLKTAKSSNLSFQRLRCNLITDNLRIQACAMVTSAKFGRYS